MAKYTEAELRRLTFGELLSIKLPCVQVVASGAGGMRLCGKDATHTNGDWIFCAACAKGQWAHELTATEHVALVIQALAADVAQAG